MQAFGTPRRRWIRYGDEVVNERSQTPLIDIPTNSSDKLLAQIVHALLVVCFPLVFWRSVETNE